MLAVNAWTLEVHTSYPDPLERGELQNSDFLKSFKKWHGTHTFHILFNPKSGTAPRVQIHYYFYSKICEYAHQVDLKKLLKDSSSDQVLPPNWIQKNVHFQNFLWSQYYRHELWTCTSSSITSYIIPQCVLTRVDLFFPYVEGNMQTV